MSIILIPKKYVYQIAFHKRNIETTCIYMPF